MPANGINSEASLILSLPVSIHREPGCTPSGSDERIRMMAAPNNTANSTPARAAARGVVRLCGVLIVLGIAIGQVCHGWPGSSRTIKPFASARSVPSASVSSELTKVLRPSIFDAQPRTVSGTSIGVTLR